MNAMTENWIAVAHLSDIPRRGARCIRNGGMTIALFRTVEDEVYAIEDKCPHRGGPLSQGIVHDGCVTCPLHNWVISLKTGKAQGVDDGGVRRYDVKREGGVILISAADLLPSRAEAA